APDRKGPVRFDVDDAARVRTSCGYVHGAVRRDGPPARHAKRSAFVPGEEGRGGRADERAREHDVATRAQVNHAPGPVGADGPGGRLERDVGKRRYGQHPAAVGGVRDAVDVQTTSSA